MRQNSIAMTEQQAGDRLAAVADALSADFARELARVLGIADRALLPLLQEAIEGNRGARLVVSRLLLLRKELRAVLERAGYDALAMNASMEAVSRMAEAYRASRLGAEGASLGRLTASRLTALARLLELDVLGVGDDAARQLWRAVVQAIYSSRPAPVLVDQLTRQLQTSLTRAQTLFDTQTSIVGRQMERIATEGRDGQAYLYVGPVDARTRDWCLDRVGLVQTRQTIDALDNGQLPNPFLTGGGYNCRHSWLAVADPALVALADTGVRSDGYDARVAMARALKDQRKRFRELRRAA